MKWGLLLAAGLALSACDVEYDRNDGHQPSTGASQNAAKVGSGPDLRFQIIEKIGEAPDTLPMLRAQVLLDRLGFSSGVIDGKGGPSSTLALKAFQRTHGLDQTGTLDEPTHRLFERWRSEPAVLAVKIPPDFAKGPFQPNFPRDIEAQAKLPALAYRGMIEALAERFHTSRATLVALNGPSAKIGAGLVVRVPAIPDVSPITGQADARGWNTILSQLGVQATQPKGEKIIVDKSEGVLRVLGPADRLIAQFPATMGSRHDPLPIGRWKILGVSRNPEFRYNPDLFWDADRDDKKALLPPGPNGPVGVVWIDLSKPHYGIHGTSEPESIGRAESHGCVRLTNWDAARVAQMVGPGTPVVFQE